MCIVVLYICKRILFLNKKENIYSDNLSFLRGEPVLLQGLVFASEIPYKQYYKSLTLAGDGISKPVSNIIMKFSVICFYMKRTNELRSVLLIWCKKFYMGFII